MATNALPPENFKIELLPRDRDLVYYAGSEVKGNLIVNVDTPQQYSNIVINLRGEGHVEWTKTTVHTTQSNGFSNFYTTTATRKANKVYIDQTRSLWSKTDTSDPVFHNPDGCLPAGRYTFPFHFQLPPEGPSSHESDHKYPQGTLYESYFMDKGSGYTRYTLTGRIKETYGGREDSDHITETRLTVKEIFDLATVPKLQLPVSKQVRKAAGFCCSCISGAVNISLELPKTGFYVEEDIPYNIRIENGGSHSVEATTTLEERIVYHTRFRKCHPKLNEHDYINNGAIQPGETITLSPDMHVLKIPASVNAIRNTSIIRQTFMLKVKVRIPHVIFDPVLTCPLTISNAPPSVEDIPSSTAQSAPSYEPLTVSVPSTNLTTTEPPSYKDAIKK